jgi:hypothetical protein
MSVLTDLIAPGGGVADLINTLIQRVWPDKEQQQQAQQQFQLQLLAMEQKGELDQLDSQIKLQLEQLQTDDDEAKNSNFFVSGARPAVMWVCTTGLAYQFVVRPFLEWASVGWWHVPVPPSLDMGTLTSLLFGLLGMGALHASENITSTISTASQKAAPAKGGK